MQQYIELRRKGQLVEARQHAQKYLTQHAGTYLEEVNRAAGLLAYAPDTQVQEYKVRGHAEIVIAWYADRDRNYIANLDGTTWPNSLYIHTTNSSRSPHVHSST